MGKLYKRGKTYYADFYGRDGQRQQRSTRTGDEKVARARLRDFELATTDSAPHATETVDAALTYFTRVACAAKPAPTVQCYRNKARHVSRLIGATTLDKLVRQVMDQYVATRLEEGAHTHSVHKELVVLRGALKSASARGLRVDIAAIPKHRSGYVPRTQYMTPEQFLVLVDHLVVPLGPKSTDESRALHAARKANRVLYCLLIALASPRKGEVEALRWDHVDLARGVMRVPKGKTISRVVAIHPELRPWLEAYRVNAGPVVEPWANSVRDLERACSRAGVPKVNSNDLRRTFASWLVQAGTSSLVVARLLGHTTTRMVDLVYGQLDEATLHAAISRLPGGSHAGVTPSGPQNVVRGAGGAPEAARRTSNFAVGTATSAMLLVPRDGVEPPTRGFSVPCSTN